MQSKSGSHLEVKTGGSDRIIARARGHMEESLLKRFIGLILNLIIDSLLGAIYTTLFSSKKVFENDTIIVSM